jgi:hypothetical protein
VPVPGRAEPPQKCRVQAPEPGRAEPLPKCQAQARALDPVESPRECPGRVQRPDPVVRVPVRAASASERRNRAGAGLARLPVATRSLAGPLL